MLYVFFSCLLQRRRSRSDVRVGRGKHETQRQLVVSYWRATFGGYLGDNEGRQCDSRKHYAASERILSCPAPSLTHCSLSRITVLPQEPTDLATLVHNEFPLTANEVAAALEALGSTRFVESLLRFSIARSCLLIFPHAQRCFENWCLGVASSSSSTMLATRSVRLLVDSTWCSDSCCSCHQQLGEKKYSLVMDWCLLFQLFFFFFFFAGTRRVIVTRHLHSRCMCLRCDRTRTWSRVIALVWCNCQGAKRRGERALFLL